MVNKIQDKEAGELMEVISVIAELAFGCFCKECNNFSSPGWTLDYETLLRTIDRLHVASWTSELTPENTRIEKLITLQLESA